MLARPLRVSLIILWLALSAGVCLARKSETWVEVRSPNFLVITNANEKQGRRVAYQFETIRAVFRQFFNLQGGGADQPVIILAARDEATLKDLLPEYWSKRGSMHPAGIYMGGQETNYVALRLDVSMNQEAYEPFEPVYHEYVHYLMRGLRSVLPLWMVEGLAEFYGNTRLEGKQVKVGVPSATNLIVLHQNAPLPLSTLFAVNASSPYYHEENKASIFYAQSWALTHYLITRDWREHTHRVSDFVALLGKNVPQEEAARRTIGDPKALEQAVFLYIGSYLFSAARENAPPGVDADSFQSAELSDAESLARRADFMALDGHGHEAQEMLEESLKLDPKLAIAYESMGHAFLLQGKMDEAAKWYSQAVALNSQSCMANYFYAVSLFKGRLDDERAAKAEASLRAAIKIAPDFASAYSALGWLLASRHQNLDEAYLMATAAVQLEPGDIQHRLNAAHVLLQMGRADAAVAVATTASAMAKTLEEQAQAMAIISNAQQLQEFQKRAKEREEEFKQAQAKEAARESSPSAPAAGSTAEQVSAPGTERSSHPLRPNLLATRLVAEGSIQEAKCPGGSTLEITLNSLHAVLQLYTDDYRKVIYNALDFNPQGILNPCTDIKGRHARITYHPAQGQPQQGEMVEVGLFSK
jgi:tetratricopeptide (TPR) repeat protein